MWDEGARLGETEGNPVLGNREVKRLCPYPQESLSPTFLHWAEEMGTK